MIAGLSGSLLSHAALERALRDPAGLAAFAHRPTHAAARSWYGTVRDVLGPACGPRQVYDLVAEPLARLLGFTPVVVPSKMDSITAGLHVDSALAAVLIAAPWGEPAAIAWRSAVHQALAHAVRWSISVNGSTVRLFDAARAYARRFAEFDLAVAVEDERTCHILCGLLNAAAFEPRGAARVLDAIVSRSDRHRAEVGVSLREGVTEALLHVVGAFQTASRAHAPHRILDESLIVVYRMLFLLFAEARALVPAWHPVYRESYTIDALQQHLERRQGSAGSWEALQAIARLAHKGCRAGALRVPPFNGRLFSPADAPLADTLPLDDRAVGRAILALTMRRSREGAERISYADLGVEQLGTVYEHLLDLDVDPTAGEARFVATGRRKATGSFYTPRTLTEFLVRRTLAPLVSNASPEAILQIRVLDPAMGSGAFLVAACRYLAAAYEQALITAGDVTAGDVDHEDRAAFRRAVAQRCLFGIDVNPMAVQLGRLSLWLATLAADKPLTFLDHHLRPGNSLVGGSIEDILRRGSAARRAAHGLPLFDIDELHGSLQAAVGSRLAISRTPDDTIQQVHGKARALAALSAADGPLERWKRAADIWCAAWYGTDAEGARGATLRALLDRVLRDDRVLPPSVADPLLTRAADTARAGGFFHWPFEFPEAFHDESGAPRRDPGFDAVLGNPPWDMLRAGRGASQSRPLAAFARTSGIYTLQGRGGAHVNLYQLFVERALRLLKAGGRLGFLLPSGFAADQASSALRAHVFARTTVDTFTTIENRDAIFPIHRGLKFLLLTLTNGGMTSVLPARSGVRSPAVLEQVPDLGVDADALSVPRGLIERVGGDTLAVPEIRGSADLDILRGIAFRIPAAADREGWQIRFGRELNVTDDRRHFTRDGRGLPVVEGKQMRPFGIDASACRFRIAARTAARLLDAETTFARPRLAYREVASATNRLTLIAAIVPARVVTSHTVFCLKTPLDEEAQQFLCGVFNSYVANYLVRMRVGTHVTAAIIARLPVPRPVHGDARFSRIAALSRRLAGGHDDRALAELNAMVAAIYGIVSSEFAHILSTLPLVPEETRSAALHLLGRDPAPRRHPGGHRTGRC